MSDEFELEIACIEKAEEICSLINEAYRGEFGWTKETEIIAGGRASIDDVKKLIADLSANFFVAKTSGLIISCIYVEEKDGKAYIGTFAVKPSIQNMGIGKQVLNQVEHYSVCILGLRNLIMVVVSQRDELISFYERRGYKRTGKLSKYPIHLNVGVPRRKGLTIECLTKIT